MTAGGAQPAPSESIQPDRRDTAQVALLRSVLRLDLADPPAGHMELLAHFLEGSGGPVLETEAELEDPALTAAQRLEDRRHLAH